MLTLPTVKELIELKYSLHEVRTQLVLNIYNSVRNRRSATCISFFKPLDEQQLQILKTEFNSSGYKFEWEFGESSMCEIVTTIYISWRT